MYAKAPAETVGSELVDAGAWLAIVTLATFALWIAFLIGRALAPYAVGVLVRLGVID